MKLWFVKILFLFAPNSFYQRIFYLIYFQKSAAVTSSLARNTAIKGSDKSNSMKEIGGHKIDNFDSDTDGPSDGEGHKTGICSEVSMKNKIIFYEPVTIISKVLFKMFMSVVEPMWFLVTF